ncbi:MAG TPA: hypothetical protein DCW44_05125 [Eubacterium sp.]|nr:hypothetical protein [Eubacterium sp.]
MLTMDTKYKKAKKQFSSVKFDLIIYASPPISIVKTIKYVKKRDKAKTYLLLKDIFLHNAVDLRMIKKQGLKLIIYKYFRRMECELYIISYKIGCMSQANEDYILKNNMFLESDKVEVFPNCIEIEDCSLYSRNKRNKKQI